MMKVDERGAAVAAKKQPMVPLDVKCKFVMRILAAIGAACESHIRQ